MAQAPSPVRKRLVDVLFVALLVFVWREGLGAPAEAGPEAPGGRLEQIRFREVGAEVGVEFTHRTTSIAPALMPLEPMIAGLGASVAVCDANGDGWPDLYSTTSADHEPNALFVNRGDGTFVDHAEAAGLADLNRSGTSCSMGSVWADWTGDGQQDVLVYGWGHCRLFENLGDLRFEERTEQAGVGARINSQAATWLDFDRDGRLDLVIAGYYSEEHDLWNTASTRVLHDSFEFARNGGRNRLYRNLGDGRFEDVSHLLGEDAPRWTMAVAAADLDRDGWQDLYLANDYGTEEVLLNQGGTGFRRATGLGLEAESKSGMCVAFGNVGNDGRLATFVTNISKAGFLFQGNNLRVNHLPEGGPMRQRAIGAVVDCGWAWGAQFGDLDSDGWQDLLVVNGFVSGDRERDYWYPMTKISGAAGGLVADAANWEPMGDRSLSGYERTRVLLQTPGGSGRFVEVGRQVGIDDVGDGRGVALGDLDRDGDLDVVVANQRGPLLVYRNESEVAGHHVAFDLVGTVSNADALGAEVRVTSSVGTQVQVVTAASGFAAQNDRRLTFGLGRDPGRVTVHVRWPAGGEDVLEDPALDQVHRLVEVAR